MIIKLREQTIQMKQFSLRQVFVGTRLVTERIIHEVESIKAEIGASKDYELNVSIDSLIKKISNNVEEFGKIIVSESANNLDFRDRKIGQAQIEIIIPASRNISDIKLQLFKTFQMKRENEINISGCFILPNGHLLMANFTNEKHLIEYSDTSEHIRDILVSSEPFDIAVIDLNRIAVTYGDAFYLEIMNNKTFNVKKKICLQECCLGVSHEDGKLYVVHGNSVQVLDVSEIKTKKTETASDCVNYIKTRRDRIFYADPDTFKVHCCHLNGDVLWQVIDNSIDFPIGVTTDNYNNVFVASYVSNTLTIIQHDGKNSKTLLTNFDGLNNPKSCAL